jgi:hypothetical protein
MVIPLIDNSRKRDIDVDDLISTSPFEPERAKLAKFKRDSSWKRGRATHALETVKCIGKLYNWEILLKDQIILKIRQVI